MKKILSLLLVAMLALSTVSAVAEEIVRNDSGTKYTMKTDGHVVLTMEADRAITPRCQRSGR